MVEGIKADICIIGAGSAGLSVAAGASQMGASTVLIEKGEMGGDCLNYGCVPSKALLAAANRAQAIREAGRFGITASNPTVDFAKVHEHVRGVIAGIAPQDSQARFEGLGVCVIRAPARFTGRRELVAGNAVVRARRFVIATGSSPLVPPIPGLDRVPFWTNETIFDNTARPAHLLVIGGGPIGIEMAQAHRRLGCEVTVLEMERCLTDDDPETSGVALDGLRREGIDIEEGARVVRAETNGTSITMVAERDGAETRWRGSHALVAVGRRPNIEGLGLEAAGVAHGARGITVDSGLRTSNRRIFAIGDVVGTHQFTHIAAYHAGIVIRRALLRLPAKVDERAIPWVTYTDPEVAQVGRTEAQARAARDDIRVLRWPYSDNDRARTERRTDGLVKVVANRRGRVLGASLVGAHAGELILPWALMVAKKLPISAMASVIAPYPTYSEASKRAAGSFYADTLFGVRTRGVVRFLSKFA